MRLVAEDRQRQADILTYLLRKGFSGCPVCRNPLDPDATGTVDWSVGREYALFTAEEETQAYRFVPVACGNCGHVLWFNYAQLPPREG
jgi:hypothetical protein